MKCSSCHAGTLVAAYIEDSLYCHTCNHCGGTLIMLSDFLRWQEQSPEIEPAKNIELEVVTQDTIKAMICPKTGGLMTKYKISSDTEHRLDLSPTINAVWLDKGEWALLKSKKLAHKLNNIFTDHWQHDIRNNETSEILTALYKRKFGDSYNEIKNFRTRLQAMENKHEIIAYLLADDPYKTT